MNVFLLLSKYTATQSIVLEEFIFHASSNILNAVDLIGGDKASDFQQRKREVSFTNLIPGQFEDSTSLITMETNNYIHFRKKLMFCCHRVASQGLPVLIRLVRIVGNHAKVNLDRDETHLKICFIFDF